MVLDLLLIRHPRTPANLEKRIQSTYIDEGPEPGYEPALETLAERIYRGGEIDTVFTSTLKRASIPAQLLLEMLIKRGHKPEYIPTRNLDERDFGIFNGHLYQEVVINANTVETMIHEVLFDMDQIIKGESYEQIRERLLAFCKGYISPMTAKAGDGIIRGVVLAHAHILNHFQLLLLTGTVKGSYTEWPYLGVRRIIIDKDYERGKPSVEVPFGWK